MTTTSTSATPTLGDLLRAKIQRDVDTASRLAQEKVDAAKALAEKEERIVQNLFDNAKSQFQADILAGRAIERIKVGDGTNDDAAALLCQWSKPPTAKVHRFHSFWVDFETWASSNGLVAVWDYGHTGDGMRGWQTLSVTPL